MNQRYDRRLFLSRSVRVVGGLTVVYLIASWAIVIGALKIAFAFRIRKLPGELESRFSLRP